MIGATGNVRIYLACGVTDMRRSINGLSALVEAEYWADLKLRIYKSP